MVYWVPVDHLVPHVPKGQPTDLRDIPELLWGPTALVRTAQDPQVSDLNEPEPITKIKYSVWQNQLND